MNLSLTDSQVKSLLQQLRSFSDKEPGWDLDLSTGAFGEHKLSEIIKKVEVKTDYKVSTTNNLAIEITKNNKPSGITTTISDWWAFILEGDKYDGEVIVMVSTDRLRGMLKECRSVTGGYDDWGSSSMMLLPLKDLFK